VGLGIFFVLNRWLGTDLSTSGWQLALGVYKLLCISLAIHTLAWVSRLSARYEFLIFPWIAAGSIALWFAWTRISSESNTAKKIFGPIGSDDGLYVEDGFLTLLVGGSFSSHFVSEWFRPMLIHIAVVNNNAIVMINGEQVISLDFSTASMSLPDGVDEDWVGFYSYEDVTPIEIDCFAIYSYRVPDVVAKRRWVYGQGVGSSESIDSAYSGTSAAIDYTFADYTANYTYPSFAQWQQGSFDNLATTEKYLKTPDYSLPTIFTGTKTLQDMYDESETLFDNLPSGYIGTDYRFISLNPNSTWDNEGAYIYFTNFNVLNDQVASL
jgi:hypothetical protein